MGLSCAHTGGFGPETVCEIWVPVHLCALGGWHRVFGKHQVQLDAEAGKLEWSFLKSKGMWFVEAGHECGGIHGAGERRCCEWKGRGVLLHLTQTAGIILLSQRGTTCWCCCSSPTTPVPSESSCSGSGSKFSQISRHRQAGGRL